MPPETSRPDDPQAWLVRARSNLARARAGRHHDDVLFEDLCFDAQQACEKALKSVLLVRGASVPRTHAIADLITAIVGLGIDVPMDVRTAAELTEYAVASRYPGPFDPVNGEDFASALATAEAVVNWATNLVNGSN